GKRVKFGLGLAACGLGLTVSLLQVAQPPIPTPGLDPSHPSAERIKRGEDQQPHDVDTGQPYAVPLREEETECQKLSRIEALYDAEGDSESVYEVQVGDVEGEWH